MSRPHAELHSVLAIAIKAFLQYKRALGCKYQTEAAALHLLDAYVADQRAMTWEQIDSSLIDAFLASRPRSHARSYNHLVGVIHRFFKWAVTQRMTDHNPVTARPRRVTGQRIPYLFSLGDARRLLDVARSLPTRSKAPHRALVYETVFALLYGLGLRVGEVTRLLVGDVQFDRATLLVRDTKFNKSRLVIEGQRHNKPQTRNQRLAGLHTFYRYLAVQHPEMLAEAQRVEAIPNKRTQPPATRYLERDEIDRLFDSLPATGTLALRDQALLMLLFNTGARVQEVVELRVGDVDLDGPLRARLHGKGDKWRACPIWPETAALLRQLETVQTGDANSALFVSNRHQSLTRFGIYKLVKRHTQDLIRTGTREQRAAISPHVFRHYLPYRTMSCNLQSI